MTFASDIIRVMILMNSFKFCLLRNDFKKLFKYFK